MLESAFPDPVSDRTHIFHYLLAFDDIQIELVYCFPFMPEYAINANKRDLLWFDMRFDFICQKRFPFSKQISKTIACAWSKSFGVVTSGCASIQIIPSLPS